MHSVQKAKKYFVGIGVKKIEVFASWLQLKKWRQYSLQVRMEFFELKMSCHCMSIKMLCYMTLESMLYTLVMCLESSSKNRVKEIESNQVKLV